MKIELNKRRDIVRPSKSHKQEEYVNITIKAINFGAKLPHRKWFLLFHYVLGQIIQCISMLQNINIRVGVKIFKCILYLQKIVNFSPAKVGTTPVILKKEKFDQ